MCKYTNRTGMEVSLSNARGLQMTEYLGIPAAKGWLRKTQHVNPNRRKDGKFQWQYKEWIYMGTAVPIITYAQERWIQTRSGKEKSCQNSQGTRQLFLPKKARKVLPVQSVKIESCKKINLQPINKSDRRTSRYKLEKISKEELIFPYY